jgi:hypothetical protein
MLGEKALSKIALDIIFTSKNTGNLVLGEKVQQ